jgi:hypothetical protein
LQNIEQPRKGFTVLKVARHGTISSSIKKGLEETQHDKDLFTVRDKSENYKNKDYSF